MYIPSPDLPLEFQTCIFSCLFDISIKMSIGHFRLNMSKTKLLVSFPLPGSLELPLLS